MLFASSIDANHLETLNFRLQNLLTAPTAATWGTGGMYYNSNVGRIQWTNGSAWYDLYASSSSNVANTTVLRDSSGNFVANIITATLSGNASTATALATARAFSITGKATASGINFDGTGAVALNVTALSVVPGDITLASGYFIVGNGSTVGAATAKSSIPLSGFGVPVSDVAMGGYKITGLSDPVNPQDAATMAYVQSMAQGLSVKDPVRAATTANITLSGAQTIDGVSVVAGDRVLVKNQTTQTENGIYVAATGAWSRSTDFDTSAEAAPNSFTFVNEGSTNNDSGWVMTTPAPITLGSSSIVWAQFSRAGTIEAGSGVVKSGSTLYFAQSSSYTTNAIPYATGTASIGFTAAGTSAQLMQANGSGVPSWATVSGDATIASGGAITIASGSVSLAKMANLAALSVIGNATSSSASPQALAGTANQVMRVDSAGTALGFGAINLASTAAVTGALGAANGGTGQSSYSIGDILYASASTTLSKLGLGAQYTLLKSNGTAPSWGAVNLASAEVTGTLQPGNGGTGNRFFQVAGAAGTVKTYTFNNQSANIPIIKTGTITGNGTQTSFPLTHSIGSTNVSVSMYDVSNNQFYVDIVASDTDKVYANFAVAPASGVVHRWVIVGF